MKFSEQIFLYADSGYQGLKEYHKNSFLPTKKPKNGELSKKKKGKIAEFLKSEFWLKMSLRWLKISELLAEFVDID